MSNKRIILDKHYNPNSFEEKIYKKWEESGAFSSNVNEKEPFTIVMPPPNITGKLHMGHALDESIQDLIIRFKRLLGYNALLLPGTDHASIATELKVASLLYDETGKTKEEIGREEFLKHAWEWKNKYGDEITTQMRKLGISCDWSKERFTMDEGLSKAVLEIFVDYYKKGYIYKGKRLVNWCPDCKTSISDAEVIHEETDGNYWYFKYPVLNENFNFDNFKSSEDALKLVDENLPKKASDYKDFITIATSRPETIFGDTAICVNPDDERYKNLVGKTAVIPFLNRKIPIVSDKYADMEKGSGAVKITPAHDFNDYEVGSRNNLPSIEIMNKDGTLNENTGSYDKTKKDEAREKFVLELGGLGFLEKIEKVKIPVGSCYRCNNIIEPLMSTQWFLKMDKLASEALTLVDGKNKELNFVPERFEKIYKHWLNDIKDWCISRQLFWGHRIPVYYCADCGETIASSEAVKTCPKCSSKNITQDESVLDTWFSSALWPFSTLGWPEKTEELDYYFPTNVLVTGYDIIFFWVVRMAFTSKYIFNKSPFKDVYIHGLVRDENNVKMSKSLGNGIDPIDVINKYGSDALRYMLIDGTQAGNDLRFSYEKIESARNFANKLHNASRFIFLNLDKEILNENLFDELKKHDKSIKESDDIIDLWMLKKLISVSGDVKNNLNNYQFSVALLKIYEFVRGEFCDWYIEFKKTKFNKDNDKYSSLTLAFFLKECLILLHPFMPFITENIYTHLISNEKHMLINEAYPNYSDDKNLNEPYKNIETVKEIVKSIRNLRTENKIENNKKINVEIVVTDKTFEKTIEELKEEIKALTKSESLKIVNKDNINENSFKAVIKGFEIYILTENLVDKDSEIKKLNEEILKVEKEIEFRKNKLSNKEFTSKAPEVVVKREEGFLKEKEELLVVLKEKLSSFN